MTTGEQLASYHTVQPRPELRIYRLVKFLNLLYGIGFLEFLVDLQLVEYFNNNLKCCMLILYFVEVSVVVFLYFLNKLFSDDEQLVDVGVRQAAVLGWLH